MPDNQAIFLTNQIKQPESNRDLYHYASNRCQNRNDRRCRNPLCGSPVRVCKGAVSKWQNRAKRGSAFPYAFWEQHENSAEKGCANICNFGGPYERKTYNPAGKDFGTTRPLPKQPFCILCCNRRIFSARLNSSHSAATSNFPRSRNRLKSRSCLI